VVRQRFTPASRGDQRCSEPTTCLSPYWPRSISPLIPMVSNALPRMQWALAGAKRLECGSLLPLCFYVQTTCLSPYRHRRASSTDLGSRGLEQWAVYGPRRNPGATPKQRVCPSIWGHTQTTSLALHPTHSPRPYRCDRLTVGNRSRYGEIDQTRSLKTFANMKDFSM